MTGARYQANPEQQLAALQAQQASAWVQILQNPSAEQRAAFVQWLKCSPMNVRDFLLMLTIERALDQLDPKRSRDIEALLAQIESQIVPLAPGNSAPSASPAAPRSRRKLFRVAAAAAAGLLLLTAVALLTRAPTDWKQIATAMGEQRAFELPDGSVIHLNTNSQVELKFSAELREVRLLQGEALFRVHHDQARPFRVYTSDAVIQAVGTQFNVYARADGTEVAVIEGRVSVTPESTRETPAIPHAPASDVRSVGASEAAHIAHGGQVNVRAAPDVSDVVAWRERRLVFRQETLERIVSEFNRYGARQIRLEGVDVATRLFSGVFDADDPDSLAQVLSRDSSLSVRYSDKGILVTTR
jgi:transmembrane sensor